ncbi:relaxase/mobilization nuclease domain-containing protein [Nocardia tengchongensis]|uniref:relaxase/mobilization nuclease domain-containing protein n=1 Tax=Nocardia tengchongensis TaxID=2055889 RepID=UPI00369A53F1
MIAKIRRGKKLSGLVTYLLGPGEHNEHKDRHIIAGSPTVMREMWLENFDGPGSDEAARETALAVADEIEIPRRLYGTQVRMKAKKALAGVGGRELGMDVLEPARKGDAGEYKDAPVWHCVLALTPGEVVSDDRWQEIADTFMERMGFTGTPDGKQAQARWVAVRHGLSGEAGEGQDHIHIAASLVREDGSKVSTFDYGPGRAKGDWKRADEICGELEHEFGLKVLASRKEGGGLSENSRAEIERAKRLGAPETERERLRRMVRAVATGAESEAEFVRGLRSAGIAITPRYKSGGTTDVSGYSVRLRRSGAEVGPWVGGGKLAGDLSLTALREQQWDDSPEGRKAALAAWASGTGKGAKRPEERGPQRGEGVGAWERASTEIETWRQRLAEVPHGDRAQWAWMAGQAAGVFAAWSETLEGDNPGAFAAAANELTRSAQLHRARDRYRPSRGTHPTVFADVTQLLLTHPIDVRPRSHAPGALGKADDAVTEMAIAMLVLMLVLLIMAIAIAVEIAKAHRARGELGRALAVEHVAHQRLDPVRAEWETELEDRRHQWDRDAADVFAAAADRAAQRGIARATTPEPGQSAAQPKWSEKAVTAARGSLTPPAVPGGDQRKPLRAFYTELPPDEKAGMQVVALVDDHNLNPRGWPDDMLDAERAHLRDEVGLLSEDIEARRAGNGPHTLQTRADIAEAIRAAEKIPAAQQAQNALDADTRTVSKLTRQRGDWAEELKNTPRIKLRARAALQTEIEKADKQLRKLIEREPTVRAAAQAAAEATGVDAREWNTMLDQADPQRQRQRLSEARDKDLREINEDDRYLRHLQRELTLVESEHDRRAQLTPEQRAREARTQSRNRTTKPNMARGPEAGATPQMPYQEPDLGRDNDQGHGL